MKKLLSHKLILIPGVICFLFLMGAIFFRSHMQESLAFLTQQTLAHFGGFYLYLGFGTVVVLLVLAFSRYGKIRLGEGKPAYSRFSWISMLYSTGMGAGLLLRAVQEPVFYFLHPPENGIAIDPAIYALKYSFFHWGFTPWAFYGMFGLLIAWFLYVKKRSIKSSSFLGDGSHSNSNWKGIIVDLFTVMCTLIGVIAALGLGSRQLLGGLGFLYEFLPSVAGTVMVVLVITLLSTTSALIGIRNSIRRLSNFNIVMAIALMGIVLIQGNMLAVFEGFGTAFFQYLRDFIPMSLNLGAQKASEDFLADWTYFYWAFWLAWAPFTGVFIARISKGRTIREFVLGTLFIPALTTFFWFSVFGTNAFETLESMVPYEGQYDSIYSSLFIFLDKMSFGGVIQLLTILLIITFLITSIDSAILVLSMYSEKENKDATVNDEGRKGFRLLWGVVIAMVTTALILIGKDSLLQSTSHLLVIIALPFSFLFLVMMGSFVFQMVQNNAKTSD